MTIIINIIAIYNTKLDRPYSCSCSVSGFRNQTGYYCIIGANVVVVGGGWAEPGGGGGGFPPRGGGGGGGLPGPFGGGGGCWPPWGGGGGGACWPPRGGGGGGGGFVCADSNSESTVGDTVVVLVHGGFKGDPGGGGGGAVIL